MKMRTPTQHLYLFIVIFFLFHSLNKAVRHSKASRKQHYGRILFTLLYIVEQSKSSLGNRNRTYTIEL